MHNLICDEAEDPAPLDMTSLASNTKDSVMKLILDQFASLLTKPPVSHESLLIDRKDNRLSTAEKKLAERAFKLEKKSKITYSRPSYAAFYPKKGTFATNLHNPGSNGFTRNRYFDNGKKLDTWASPYASPHGGGAAAGAKHGANPRVGSLNGTSPALRAESTHTYQVNASFPTPSFSNVIDTRPPASHPPAPQAGPFVSGYTSGSDSSVNVSRGSTSTIAAAASHQPKQAANDSECSSSAPGTPPSRMRPLSRPASPGSSAASCAPSPAASSSSSGRQNNAMEALSRQGVDIRQVTVPRDLVIPTNMDQPPIRLQAGQAVMVIQTPKGIYLRMDEKIIKIKQQVAVNGLFGNQGMTEEDTTGLLASPESSEPQLLDNRSQSHLLDNRSQSHPLDNNSKISE